MIRLLGNLASPIPRHPVADGSLTMADWLAYRCNISRTTAGQWVRAATALEDLPRIRARFVAGDLSEPERDAAGNATINGHPITDAVLRRFLCDTRIEVSFDTPDGRTVGVGRATRNPPAWLRRRVIGRDHARTSRLSHYVHPDGMLDP